MTNTHMHPLKTVLLTLGCALELLWQGGSLPGNIWQSLPRTDMWQPASPTHWHEEKTVKSHESWTSLWPQMSAAYLVYFWMPISFEMDSGRMMTRHMMKRANRWSVYQWYGISPSLDPVTVSYKEIQTGEEHCWMSIIYLLRHEGISILDRLTIRPSRFTKDSFTFCILPNSRLYDFLTARLNALMSVDEHKE